MPIRSRTNPPDGVTTMRSHAFAVRLGLFLAFAAGLVFAGCKSSSTSGSGGPTADSNKTDGRGDARVEAAKRQSINNLKQMAIAMLNYHDAMQTFPTPGLPKGAKAPGGFYPPHSWRVQILPYIEQQNLWNLIPMGGMGPLPDMLPKTPIKLFQNPLGVE